MIYKPLTKKEEHVATDIVDSAFKVHSVLGPGLLESIYETCFCHELKKHGLNFQRQVCVPIQYDGVQFESGLRLDILVEECVICELKASDGFNPTFHAQLLSYLKMTGKRLGFLINFHVPLITHGIRRIIL
jgi:GxxExxY protein